jgi:hypothetical protein
MHVITRHIFRGADWSRARVQSNMRMKIYIKVDGAQERIKPNQASTRVKTSASPNHQKIFLKVIAGQ